MTSIQDADAFVFTRTWTGLSCLGVLIGLALLVHFLIRLTEPAPDSEENPAVTVRRRGIKSLVIGSDGRASTSKVQALLWTGAVFYALLFLLVWGRSIGCDKADARTPICRAAAEARTTFDGVTRQGLQNEYYILLGLPFIAAIAAKAMTQNAKERGTLEKPDVEPGQKGVLAGVAEVVSNDRGQADLVDFQYFGFNLLTLGFFFAEFLTKPSGGLPTLPRTLLALSGIAAATYTTKKGLETNKQNGGAQ